MMKKIAFSILILLVAFTSVSCRYDEGPYISFINPEERLVGYWKLDAVYLNDNKIDSTDVLPNKPGCYYAFFTERMVSVSALQGTTYYESMYGEWALQNHEKELYVNFVLRNKRYTYTAEIRKLSKKILIYEFYDDQGDKWRFEFFTRSNLY